MSRYFILMLLACMCFMNSPSSTLQTQKHDARQALLKLIERPRVPLDVQRAVPENANGLMREAFSFAAEAP